MNNEINLFCKNSSVSLYRFHCVPLVFRVDHFPSSVLIFLNLTFNSSPTTAAYMHQWIKSVLVQIMACRLFGAKPLSEPMLGYCQLNPLNKIQWIFNRNTNLFIHENASQNIVCQKAAILSRGRWVNSLAPVIFGSNINPLHAKFFRVNINMYLHFMSFLHIDRTQVLKILPQVR